MADLLIKIGTFTKREIDIAVERSLPVDEREKFQEQLKKIATYLDIPKKTKRHLKRPRDIDQQPTSAVDQPPPSPPGRQPPPSAENQPIPGGSKTPSNIESVVPATPPGRQSDYYSLKIFNEKIVPQIRRRIEEYERLHKDLEWNLKLSFLPEIYNLQRAGLTSIKIIHKKLIDSDETAVNLLLIIAYHRGMCYLSAREYIPGGISLIQWFPQEFGLPYITVHRYCLFATLIQSYPGLICCGLSFTQITKHHNRIMKLIENDGELGGKLKSRVDVLAQNEPIHILPVKMQVLEDELPINVDPDFCYDNDADYFKDGVDKSVLVKGNIKTFFSCLSEVEDEHFDSSLTEVEEQLKDSMMEEDP
jgi:hypothetical protein